MLRHKDVEELLNVRIIEAFEAGFSVVEITRLLGSVSVSFVHKLLRNSGYIGTCPKSEKRRKYNIDTGLSRALKWRDYSFGRWCLGWKLNPFTAEAELRNAPDDGKASKAHEALLRDFPDIYFRIYGGKRPRRERKREPARHLKFIADWDSERKTFIGSVPAYPQLEASGKDWEELAFNMKSLCWKFESIAKLDRLIATSRE